MATFSTTENQTGLASVSCAASGTKTFTLDLRTKLGATLEIRNTGGGTVAAGAAVTVAISTSSDGTTYATVASISLSITTVASTLQSASIFLEGGRRYQCVLTNGDATNATTLAAIYETIDGIA
jgi:hypothetical protein